MTLHKHLKTRVRTRMQRTGESYTTARRIVLSGREPDQPAAPDVAGLTPEATTLRVLLTAAGAVAPHTGRRWSEPMLYGLSGGIGIAAFAFRYEADDVSTLFLGARRHDTADGLVTALDLLGVEHAVTETGGARSADRQLRGALDAHGPAAAWVDMAALGTRGLPAAWAGGTYHVLAVLGLDDDAGTARLADLADVPVVVDQQVLAAARGRIRKQRHRLLSVTGAPPDELDLGVAVRGAVAASHAQLTTARARGHRLDALDDLADRMGGAGADSWARVFPRGRHLWTALTSLHLFIEHYGSGGGLGRPLYARFLHEAAVATGDDALARIGERYDRIGRGWTALAHAALPDDVPLLAEARALHEVHDARYASQGADAAAQLQEAWMRLDELGVRAADDFPLDGDEADALRADLARRVRVLADAERDAAAALAQLTRATG